MSETFDLVMTEHAAWLPMDGGSLRVLATPDGGRWLATVQDCMLAFDPLTGTGAEPMREVFTLSDGLDAVPELATALRGLGSVLRLRNTNLWDAIGVAIIRQVIRAGQAKRLYRTFCEAYGDQIALPSGGTYALFPAPEIALELSNEQYSSIGMEFKRRPLRAAAEAYLEQGEKWQEITPGSLTQELQVVPRIGPWTAHAAVADWSNDWSLYPYADLAVRTWAKRAAPSYDWPDDEPTFGRIWRALAGEHLCSLTLMTLAWGSQHGDIG